MIKLGLQPALQTGIKKMIIQFSNEGLIANIKSFGNKNKNLSRVRSFMIIHMHTFDVYYRKDLD